ncbi:MAG TPA: glutamate 5-kinase [Burkholderiaceae bacterium]|nr:glutamate 5-kinase [Burkholderiaceae bacterium]
MRSFVAVARRVVVKIGSSSVTTEGRGLDRAAIDSWARQIAALHADGKQVLLVSSGAIAEGMQRLGWKRRPHEIHELQAAAAVGQMGLAQAYEASFRAHGLRTAQVLLTHTDLADRARYLNARSTLFTLLKLGVVPVINENDTVVTDEIKFGDNDTLGALVANLVEADALIILTDQEGIYSSDPRRDASATVISEAMAGDPSLEAVASGAGSATARGGMITKVMAAKRAARSGAHTIIAASCEPDVLIRLAQGEAIGSQLIAGTAVLTARKQWLASHLQCRGQVTIDDGAARALTAAGKSLLPIGVIEVKGEFQRGDVVACVDALGREVARGLANYSSAQSRLIARRPTTDIESVLGFIEEPELIHRDNLVLT